VRLYQRIIAGGLVAAGFVGLLCYDNNESRTEKSELKFAVAVEIYFDDNYGSLSIAVGDVTGDKSPDLVFVAERIREREVGVYVFDNQGYFKLNEVRRPTLIAYVPLYERGRRFLGGGSLDLGLDVALGDFDNDGDFDIAFAAERLDRKETTIFKIENLGNNRYANLEHLGNVPLFQAGRLNIVTQDIDRDGRIDILVSAEHPSKREANTYSFVNKGNNSFEAVK
jgi:hypothetical protein